MTDEFNDDSHIRSQFPPLHRHEGSWVVIQKVERIPVCEIFRNSDLNKHSQYLDERFTILPFIDYMMAFRGASDDGPIFSATDNRDNYWRGKGCARDEYNFVSCNRETLKEAHLQMRQSAQGGDFKINQWDRKNKEWNFLYVFDTKCVLGVWDGRYGATDYASDRNDPFEDRMKETNLYRTTTNKKRILVVSSDTRSNTIPKFLKLLKDEEYLLNGADILIATGISTNELGMSGLREVNWSRTGLTI